MAPVRNQRFWLLCRGETRETVWAVIQNFAEWPPLAQQRFKEEFGSPQMFDAKAGWVQVLELDAETTLKVRWEVLCGFAMKKLNADRHLWNSLPEIDLDDCWDEMEAGEEFTEFVVHN